VNGRNAIKGIMEKKYTLYYSFFVTFVKAIIDKTLLRILPEETFPKCVLCVLEKGHPDPRQIKSIYSTI
jgi:hypothetical protein